MGDRLATIDMGRKIGVCVPIFFGGGEAGPHLTQNGLDRGLPSYQVAPGSIQPFVRNRHMGRKLGAVPLLGTGARSPSNTMWLGPRPTYASCVPSFIWIRPTVWPQYINVTDRTGQRDRTDNGLVAYGEPFYKRSSPKFRI